MLIIIRSLARESHPGNDGSPAGYSLIDNCLGGDILQKAEKTAEKERRQLLERRDTY